MWEQKSLIDKPTLRDYKNVRKTASKYENFGDFPCIFAHKDHKEEKILRLMCPVLDVWSQGETRTEAKENLREALQLFLIDCFERGTLDKVLKESGFTAARTPIKEQSPKLSQRLEVALPFIIDDRQAKCQG